MAALAVYKPVRVLLPQAFGLHCEQGVCVDDPGQREAAVALFEAAKGRLKSRHGLDVDDSKIVFCRSEECRGTFGLGKRAGFTFGALGIVIAPRGWKEHYVAHELVHHWQAETFGGLAVLNGEQWLIEGMAYALSDDPRELLHEPFESYRRKFSEWHRLNPDIPLAELIGKVL